MLSFRRILTGRSRPCHERRALLESFEILVRKFEQSSADLAALSLARDRRRFWSSQTEMAALKIRMTEAWNVYCEHVGRHQCRL